MCRGSESTLFLKKTSSWPAGTWNVLLNHWRNANQTTVRYHLTPYTLHTFSWDIIKNMKKHGVLFPMACILQLPSYHPNQRQLSDQRGLARWPGMSTAPDSLLSTLSWWSSFLMNEWMCLYHTFSLSDSWGCISLRVRSLIQDHSSRARGREVPTWCREPTPKMFAELRKVRHSFGQHSSKQVDTNAQFTWESYLHSLLVTTLKLK